MAIIPWKPLTDLNLFRHQLEPNIGLFRRQFDNLFDAFFAPSTRLLNGNPWNPVCKTEEKDNEYDLVVELPGVDEKNVAVQLSGNLLTISANRSTETKDKDRSESWSGEFTRTVSLPDTVDSAKIEASYAKGVLTVKLPKLPQAKAKTIPIKSA